jgi:hypothetical protein
MLLLREKRPKVKRVMKRSRLLRLPKNLKKNFQEVSL